MSDDGLGLAVAPVDDTTVSGDDNTAGDDSPAPTSGTGPPRPADIQEEPVSAGMEVNNPNELLLPRQVILSTVSSSLPAKIRTSDLNNCSLKSVRNNEVSHSDENDMPCATRPHLDVSTTAPTQPIISPSSYIAQATPALGDVLCDGEEVADISIDSSAREKSPGEVSTRSEETDTVLPDEAISWPSWFQEDYKFFIESSSEEEWRALVALYIEFEKRMGFPSGMVSFSV